MMRMEKMMKQESERDLDNESDVSSVLASVTGPCSSERGQKPTLSSEVSNDEYTR